MVQVHWVADTLWVLLSKEETLLFRMAMATQMPSSTLSVNNLELNMMMQEAKVMDLF